MRFARRRWLRLLLFASVSLLIGAAVVTFALGWRRGLKLVYPLRSPICCQTPADYQLEYQDVVIETADALKLRGWYIPAKNRAAIIVAHGAGGNRVAVLPFAAILARHGYGVLLIDLRAHGDSDGTVYAYGWRDIIAAADFLRNQTDIDPKRIGALGFSLGGVAVLEGVAHDSAIAAVISDGAGAVRLEDFPPRRRLIDWWFWFYDLGNEQAILRETGEWDKASMRQTVAAISPRPLFLIAAGAADSASAVEAEINQHLFEAAGGEKQLWSVPNAIHTTGFAIEPVEYERRIVAFFDDALLR
ncbi:MAG: alpha/beta fold hydrolase [Anaerolineae bacterium]|nr:alpha/beta fold hydrolase [Anaerolineae bacterium]